MIGTINRPTVYIDDQGRSIFISKKNRTLGSKAYAANGYQISMRRNAT
jgi:hypothetical protein